jgi:hypothetical protein
MVKTKELIDRMLDRVASGELSKSMRKKYVNAIKDYLRVMEKKHPDYKANYEKKHGKEKRKRIKETRSKM